VPPSGRIEDNWKEGAENNKYLGHRYGKQKMKKMRIFVGFILLM
jgi:hypothetical protein